MNKENLNTFKKENTIKLQENYFKYQNFLDKFWKSKIDKLTLESYCIWTWEWSFSYDLEFWLKELWSIGWWSSFKFWIFKNSKWWYSFVSSRFEDENNALERIKKAIKTIINLDINISNQNELDEISKVFSPMVAKKIIYLFHIEELLPIYSNDLLEEFLKFRETTEYDLSNELKWWINANKKLLNNEIKIIEKVDKNYLKNLKNENIIKTDLISRILFEEKKVDKDEVNQKLKSDSIEEDNNIYESLLQEKLNDYNNLLDKKNIEVKEDINLKIIELKNELIRKSAEQVGILWVILTVIVMNTSIFSKLEIRDPQDIFWTILLINTLPIIFYFVVLFLWDKKLENEKNKIFFFWLFLIIQFLLAYVFLFGKIW